MTPDEMIWDLKHSHYDWLRENLISFLQAVGFEDAKYCQGLIVAHGDKCYCDRDKWEDEGIPFEHGVAIYLLTYLSPWQKEVRETKNGWVDPCKWVTDKYSYFKQFLPPAYERR